MPIETNGCGSNQTIGLSWGLTRSATTVHWLFNKCIDNQIFSNTYFLTTNLKGFNGKEKDDEVKGEGNCIAFEARIYDDRLGRFLTSDPLEGKYPGQSTYVFAFDNPIAFIDFLDMGEGDDPDPPKGTEVYDQNGTLIDVLNTSTNQRIMVNANEYTSYKETYLTPQKDDVKGEETTPNLSNESVADDFSKGVIDHMESMEAENEGSYYIAYGTGENILYFYGTTEDVTNSNGEVRQKAVGAIAYLCGFDNGKYAYKDENIWYTNSGPWGNGALANGLWIGTEIYWNSQFQDLNGTRLGIRLTHVGSTTNPMTQSAVTVNSTNDRPYIVIHFAASNTNGCPGVTRTPEQTARFAALMKSHFETQKNIKLVVNVKGNTNVTEDISGDSHY